MQLLLLLIFPQAIIAAVIQTCHHLPYHDNKKEGQGQYYFCLTEWLSASVTSKTFTIELDDFFDHKLRSWEIDTFDMLCTMSGIQVNVTSVDRESRPSGVQGCRVSIQDNNVKASWTAVVYPSTKCQIMCIIYRYRQNIKTGG